MGVTAKDDQAYESAVKQVHGKLGIRLPMYVNGEIISSTEESSHTSPVDTRITVSYFSRGTRADAKAAIDAAGEAYWAWSELPYRKRTAILRKAAELLVSRRYELAAWMAFEVGKNRYESLAEVSEAAELIRYYCDQMEANRGFRKNLESPGPKQETHSVLRPYGVWTVISPWNFPLALPTGMSAGALASGNTVVLKPSSESPVVAYEMSRAFADAGVPRGVLNLVTGSGQIVGAELMENSKVDGLIFTGSKEVGMHLHHDFTKNYPKPTITEMGGKNPAIVTSSADLEAAAEGVMRAAFGFGGQKCSACSRVYVHKEVKEKFLAFLKSFTQKHAIVGDPTRKDILFGPLINSLAVDTYSLASNEARRDGATFIHGGKVLKEREFEYGYFVEPTIVDALPVTHRLFRDELFVPFLVIGDFDSFDTAMELANSSEYGLCASIYSKKENEVSRFFERIEAGVTFANRRRSATTGAWPGVCSFGGWKGSGSTGKSALGPYYVQQFMREQSRWVVK